MTWTHPSQSAVTLLELLQRRGVGPAKVRDIVRRATEKCIDIATMAAELLPAGDADTSGAQREVARILKRCEQLEVAVVGLADEAYPARLRAIPDPPPVLYVRGPVPLLHEQGVAVVGTREASSAGLRAARTIAEYLVRRNIVVVSGLALGIDAAAHNGALDGGGKTIAVLAHGLHMVAPATNRPIASRLLDQGGALISEHPPDVPPRPPEFVRRNRMQSGLSFASIVVESGAAGGAIHQAQFTVDQGRHLLVVLANPRNGSSDLREEGARALIARLGARPITGTGDLGVLLDELPRETPSKRSTESKAAKPVQEGLWKA